MSLIEMHSAPTTRRASSAAAAVWVVLASAGLFAPIAGSAAETKTLPKQGQPAANFEKAEAEREKQLDAARKRLDEAAREVAELSMQMSEDAMPHFAGAFGSGASRAMLGVNIGRGQDRKEGVELLSVSPGGPAAEAGLKAGDVIVELKGKPLKQTGDETPREKLLAVVREAKPDEEIAVRYVRDGKSATTNVVARPVDRVFTMPLAVAGRRVGGMPNFRFMRTDGGFGSAELVALTPKLGQYFGTDKGLLVVRAPGADIPLEEGDVILDIDGRVPSNPSHAYRILGSYESGEVVKLNVMRMKKRLSTSIKIPEDTWERHIERSHMFVPPPPGDVPVPPPSPAPGAPIPPRDDTA